MSLVLIFTIVFTLNVSVDDSLIKWCAGFSFTQKISLCNSLKTPTSHKTVLNRLWTIFFSLTILIVVVVRWYIVVLSVLLFLSMSLAAKQAHTRMNSSHSRLPRYEKYFVFVFFFCHRQLKLSMDWFKVHIKHTNIDINLSTNKYTLTLSIAQRAKSISYNTCSFRTM